MKNLSVMKRFIYIIVLFITAAPVFADVKIKSQQTVSGQTSENTVYIKGKRQRTESAGGDSVTIMQCDLKRNIQIMPQAEAYTINPFAEAAGGAATETVVDKKTTTSVTKGGTITTTITTKDTGERKQMFGYTARHIITIIESVSSPDACSPVNTKMQQDGWYIDAAFALSCSQNSYGGYVPKTPGGCTDKVQTKQIGPAKTGYALLEKMTMYDASGKESFTMINEVVELSQATLNNSLFEIPEGFKEFKNPSDMYTANASKMSGQMGNIPGINNMGAPSSMANLGGNGADSGLAANIKNMNNQTGASAAEVGEKKPGYVRVGIANVKTGSVGEGMSATELAAAVGNSLVEYLKSPNVEVVRLESKLPSQVDAEAARKSCDYVLYANISHKKGGGGGFGSMFGKAAGGMLGNMIPMGGGIGGAIAGQVASTVVVTAATTAGNVKSKDELTLEYKLVLAGSTTPTIANILKAKAKSDGEDILSGLIEQVAQAVVDAVGKNKRG